MKTTLPFVTASLALIALSARADIIEFQLDGNGGAGLLSTNVNGALNGVPGSGGIGTGGISLDTDTNELSIDIAWGSGNGFIDLTSNVSVMHIHGPTANPAPTGFGENAGVLVGLSGFDPSATDGSYVGTVTLTQQQEAEILAGRAYINVHTATNGGGEIRGQLVAAPTPSSLLFTEDFSSGDGGFTVTNEGGHADPWAYDPVAGSWSTDGSEVGTPNQHTRLTSPELTIETAGNYVLLFDHRYDIEGGNWDGGAVFLSVNGGAFTYVENTEFTENGYTTGGLIGAHALIGLTAFGGISPGHPAGTFITTEAGPFTLDAGDTLQIQFLMANDEFAVGTMTPNWEIDQVTVATLEDTDGDGMPNFYEEANGLDPNLDDADDDLDMDQATNFTEFVNGTDPQDPDSDDDTLIDGVESNTGEWLSASDTGTDPLNPDTDGDGIGDEVEDNSMVFVNGDSPGTNPNLSDTDGDGFDDGAEILAGTNPLLASSFPAIPPVIGYWPFDDQASPTADLSPAGNDGMVNGGAGFVLGHTGEGGDFAIDFDGVDDSVTTAVSLLSGLSEYTMSGWVNIPAQQTGNRKGFWGQNDAVEFGMINPTTIEFWSAQGGVMQAGGVAFGPTTANWTHIVATNSPTERKLYIDGVEAGTGASGGAPSSAFTFNIGGGGIQDGTGNFFLGQIDDVAVWDEVLTPQQIADLASMDLTPLGPSDVRPFQIVDISLNQATSEVTIEWNSKPNREYSLFAATNPADPNSWIELVDGLPGVGETTSTTETVDTDLNPTLFFRIVELP